MKYFYFIVWSTMHEHNSTIICLIRNKREAEWDLYTDSQTKLCKQSCVYPVRVLRLYAIDKRNNSFGRFIIFCFFSSSGNRFPVRFVINILGSQVFGIKTIGKGI